MAIVDCLSDPDNNKHVHWYGVPASPRAIDSVAENILSMLSRPELLLSLSTTIQRLQPKARECIVEYEESCMCLQS